MYICLVCKILSNFTDLCLWVHKLCTVLIKRQAYNTQPVIFMIKYHRFSIGALVYHF